MMTFNKYCHRVCWSDIHPPESCSHLHLHASASSWIMQIHVLLYANRHWGLLRPAVIYIVLVTMPFQLCATSVFSSVCSLLTLTLPGPSTGVSGSLDSYCSLKPLCSGMGEVVPARTSPTLLPPSPRTVVSLSCFKVLQCINCRDWHCKS